MSRFNSVSKTVLEFHPDTQSVGATGGVYKGQKRIHHLIMTGDYKGFLVHGKQLQLPIPDTNVFTDSLQLSLQAPVDTSIVAHVQPRASKSITDLLSPKSSPYFRYVVPTNKFENHNSLVRVSFVIGINQTNHSTN